MMVQTFDPPFFQTSVKRLGPFSCIEVLYYLDHCVKILSAGWLVYFYIFISDINC